jgi:hypothetical protein
MLEYVIYPLIGFVGTLLGLEAAWHFTACKIPRDTIKPCIYKQAKLAFVKVR